MKYNAVQIMKFLGIVIFHISKLIQSK